MAASGAERRPRRGPAPIASFDHDVSDESSPENKQATRLPEIREDRSSPLAAGAGLAPPEQRARSHSSPAVHSAGCAAPAGSLTPTGLRASPAGPLTPAGLHTPAAPRIDISRASSSSHQDSRDSSPELALFAGGGGGEDARARLELGFREDGALDLRSSTEELAFLEGAPGGPEPRPPPAAPPSRRHSRKDSQGSEAALLGVSGRTSRLSSVGSQCSAHSGLSNFSHASRVSRLSVVSGVSRSPSPHKMLLETSFCGPKPIETDPEICAAAVEERLLEIAKLSTEVGPRGSVVRSAPPPVGPGGPPDARDRREVRTEATVESARPASAPRLASPGAPPPTPAPEPAPSSSSLDDEKRIKESINRARVEERRARSRDRREPNRPEVYKPVNQTKDIIRIKLKPDDEYDNNDDDESERAPISIEPARKPATLELAELPARPGEPPSPKVDARRPRDSRTPSPSGVPVSRKSSFCSLFKSRETIASPDSPSEALRRKKSLTEGRSRSKSRDRSSTPTSAGKIKGSVLSLFKTPRRSAASPSPGSRDASPVIQTHRQFPQPTADRERGEILKYYEESKNGIIHIPLRTPPDESNLPNESTSRVDAAPARDPARPTSAPQVRAPPDRQLPVAPETSGWPLPPTRRTVLPDGSIIIPLHSPTEKTAAARPEPATDSVIESLARETHVGDIVKTAADDGRGPKLDTAAAPKTSPIVGRPPGEVEAARPRKKERMTFTTHVGSTDQVFSTQFSITKTPSVTSEISESIPSFQDGDDGRTSEPPRPDSSLRSERSLENGDPPAGEAGGGGTLDSREVSWSPSPDPGRDSSGSEASSDAAAPRGGSDAERRGLVVQESFEELPYVPTTLPLERSLALPMVPVRDRGGVRVAGVQRPRATRRPAGCLGALAAPPAGSAPRVGGDRLLIRLPRRARAASTACAETAGSAPRPERARSRSGGDVSSVESRSKGDWIDFSEVPERRKQPKRIQTLPAAARDAVLFSYVPPERCRCECHAHAHAPGAAPQDDELPLLAGGADGAEGADGAVLRVDVHVAACALPPRPP